MQVNLLVQMKATYGTTPMIQVEMKVPPVQQALLVPQGLVVQGLQEVQGLVDQVDQLGRVLPVQLDQAVLLVHRDQVEQLAHPVLVVPQDLQGLLGQVLRGVRDHQVRVGLLERGLQEQQVQQVPPGHRVQVLLVQLALQDQAVLQDLLDPLGRQGVPRESST